MKPHRVWILPGKAPRVLKPPVPPEADENPDKLFRHACLGAAAFFLGLAFIINLLPAKVSVLTARFFLADEPWLLAMGLCSALASRVTPADVKIQRWRIGWTSALLTLALFAVAFCGASLLLKSYGLSRDEAMVDFDASIFAGGHLLAAVPEKWRLYVNSMEPLFVLTIKDQAGWVSSYLPVNAALRSSLALIASPLIAGPFFSGVALLALVGIARRLWPDRPDAAIVAGLMLASSSQVAVAAMTPYAMTAHLALNLVWLLLFLQDTKTSVLGAVAVGFFATGLHQLAFHPLFASPFIAMLWLRDRPSRAWAYTLSYAAIILFWTNYWHLMFGAYSLDGTSTASSVSFAGRILRLAHAPHLHDVEVMLMNAARFATWQNPLLLPLVFLTLSQRRWWTDTTTALLTGILATLVMVSAVMVDQGYGWGYRYLHGFIGSFALLATSAYVELTRVKRSGKFHLSAQVATATVFATMVMLPLRSLEARSLTLPYAAAAERIRTTKSNLVFVDPDAIMNASDLVRNSPDLSNTPLVFDLTKLDEGQIRTLCGSYDIAIFDVADARALDLPLVASDQPDASLPLRSLMRSIGCGHPMERRQP